MNQKKGKNKHGKHTLPGPSVRRTRDLPVTGWSGVFSELNNEFFW